MRELESWGRGDAQGEEKQKKPRRLDFLRSNSGGKKGVTGLVRIWELKVRLDLKGQKRGNILSWEVILVPGTCLRCLSTTLMAFSGSSGYQALCLLR